MTINISKNKLKKILIRTLLGFLIFLFLLIISGFLLIYYNQDTIKKIFVEELNKSLLTEISVKDISFSVFEKFPNASLSFKNIVAKDALKASAKDTLINAQSIYLEFNIWDLYYKKYNIKNIEINNAKIFLKVDKNGNDNYHFWKTSKDAAPSVFTFSLKKIQFNNVEVVYFNNAAHQFYDFYIEKASAKGNFSNEIQDLQLKGKLIIKQFQSGEMVYLSNDKAYISAEALINTKKERIEIKKGDLQINGLDFTLLGYFTYKQGNKSINLTIKGKNIQLLEFIKELPTDQQSYLENYESKGIFDLSLKIKGLYGGANIPSLIANFSFRDGEILQKQTKAKLTNVIFKGSYTNNASIDIQKHTLIIQQFSCKLENGSISGNFTINDFKNPYINCQANAAVNLEEIHQFIKNEKITDLKGKMSVNFNFRGKINKEALNINDFINSQTTGNANLSNVTFSLKNDTRQYQISNGDLEFTNNDIIINTLNGRISGSDFNLKGSFRNVIPFIFIENQKIQVDADLFSENINLDELIGTNSKSKSNSELHFSDNYTFNLNLHINHINFKKFKANSVKGNVVFMNPVFKADNISMNSMNGNLSGNMMIDGSQPKKYKISCDVTTSNVDAHQLFEVFDNFGQKSLTSDNLKGNITSKIQFAANFNSYLQIDKKSVWAILDLKIDNGRLINYQPMMKLSRFVNAEELKDIRFNSLQNQLLIKNEMITIPVMQIKSNAINIDISGEHKFNNEINYRITLLLSELTSKKRKAKKIRQQLAQQEFGYEEDDGLGRSKLFLKVTGTIDNPIFKYDTKSLKEKLLNDFKKEKQNLQKVLKEEFKWLRKDSADIIQEKRFKIQEKGKYVIDWDEETKQKPTKINVTDSMPPSGVRIKWEEE